MKTRLFLLICGFVITAKMQAQTLQDSLILHYNFNNATAADQSGNGLHGTVFGPVQAPDRFGNATGAMAFDGMDDYIQLPIDTALHPGFPMSASVWIKVGVGGKEFVFTNDYSNNVYNGVSMVVNANGTISAGIGNGGAVSSTSRNSKNSDSLITPNAWTHVLAIYRGVNDMDICINGQNAGGTYEGSATAMMYSGNSGVLGMGDNTSQPGGEDFFTGSMDDIRFYNRALSVSECMTLYQEELVGIQHPQDGIAMALVPNPATQQAWVVLSDARESLHITCMSLEGRSLIEVHRDFVPAGGRVPVPLDGLAAGLYLIRVESKQGTVTKRLAVQ